jgi:carbonic anhydrase/acetyltransferase-like protein (isoleucine patch superfamily)
MQRLLKLKKVLKNSILATSVENFKGIRAGTAKYRHLTEDEIQILEKNGNRSESWDKVMVEPDFDPNRIIRSSFMGEVYLPKFFGTLLLPGDVSFPTGIYDSLVHNCFIENALVHKVAMLSNILVRSSAVVQNVGSIISSGKISYMIGNSMHVGNEMGGRKVAVFPEITMELVEAQLFHKPEPEVAAAFDEQLKAYREETALPFGVVGKGAVVCNTNIIRNSWIGAHARIEGAEKIRNSVVLSSLEEPSHVYDSVILENSNVQKSVTIHTGAEVQGSVLMSRTTVACKAIVKSSIIAPCCHIEEGEVNSSYVGPMTQMHHHSLLIAALWPEGCGNLGYGANVGSNHTGRMPDQEVMPGQGMFFGLGVNIKFPANYRESPFTLIATGLTTLPQRVKFPFSLIRPGDPQLVGVAPRLNEIVPGWNYARNAYALDRNLYKYSLRGKGIVPATFYSIFSPDTVRYVYDAYQRLQVSAIRDIYTKEHIDGLGENFMRERIRQQALKTYQEYMERYALEQIITLVVNDQNLQAQPVKELRRMATNDANKDVMRVVNLPETFDELLKRYRQLEKDWYERVTHGLDKDNERGRQIFDDYDDAHPIDKGFTEWEKARVEEKLRRLNSIVKTAKPE